jgi:hypothetical protein
MENNIVLKLFFFIFQAFFNFLVKMNNYFREFRILGEIRNYKEQIEKKKK